MDREDKVRRRTHFPVGDLPWKRSRWQRIKAAIRKRINAIMRYLR